MQSIESKPTFHRNILLSLSGLKNKPSKKKAGRAVAHAVSRRLPTAVARVRAPNRLCGICGGQRGTGTGFVQVLRFPQSNIPPIAPHSSLSKVGTIAQ
jgi:hypothetical protein